MEEIEQRWIITESGFAVPKTSTEPRRGEVNITERSVMLRLLNDVRIFFEENSDYHFD